MKLGVLIFTSIIAGSIAGVLSSMVYIKWQKEADDVIQKRNECISCLRMIDIGKAIVVQKYNLKPGDLIDTKLLNEEHAWPYKCPSGGVYEIGPVGDPPVCSISGHVLVR